MIFILYKKQWMIRFSKFEEIIMKNDESCDQEGSMNIKLFGFVLALLELAAGNAIARRGATSIQTVPKTGWRG
jgi:hypothetical protein